MLFLPVTVLVMVLSGCSTLPSDSEESATAAVSNSNDELLLQREQQLSGSGNWLFNARFSFITENEAWSGKLTWQQDPNEYFIHFSDPTGQGVMQLSANDDQVDLRLADGNNYQAKDAETLLRQETNWNLPIKSLFYWVRALPDRRLALRSKLDSRGLPILFNQQGWEVSYQSYQKVDNRYFPRKIIIKKQDLKLKLIIMNWMVESF